MLHLPRIVRIQLPERHTPDECVFLVVLHSPFRAVSVYRTGSERPGKHEHPQAHARNNDNNNVKSAPVDKETKSARNTHAVRSEQTTKTISR